MTIDQLDELFPNRRAECERLGLNPDEKFIPNNCLFGMTEVQKDRVFPNRRAAFAELYRRTEKALMESEAAS